MSVIYRATHRPEQMVVVSKVDIDALPANQRNARGHTPLARNVAARTTCFAGVRRDDGFGACQNWAIVSRFVPVAPGLQNSVLRYLCATHATAPSLTIPAPDQLSSDWAGI